nr:MAG TPA: hypothetical protein [Caudoviricetes sp.]
MSLHRNIICFNIITTFHYSGRHSISSLICSGSKLRSLQIFYVY